MSRFDVAIVVAVGVVPYLMVTAPAAAEPSPGVPCLEIVQQLAASPPSISESLDTATGALNSIVPEAPPTVPPVPIADAVHGLTALAAPGPIPAPLDAAPLVQAAGGGPLPAVPTVPGAVPAGPVALPPIPAAAPLPPPVPVVAGPPVGAPPAQAVQPTSPSDAVLVSAPAEPPALAPAPAAAEVPPEPIAPEPIAAEAIAAEPIAAPVVPPPPESAPVMHASGVAPVAPGPVIPVVPAAALPVPAVPVPAGPAGVPVAAAQPLPAVPLGDALPGIPFLPATLPVPTDLICEGTAWSAGRDGADTSAGAEDPQRREDW